LENRNCKGNGTLIKILEKQIKLPDPLIIEKQIKLSDPLIFHRIVRFLKAGLLSPDCN